MTVFASKSDLFAAWARLSSDNGPPPDLDAPYDQDTMAFFQFMFAYREGWKAARTLPEGAEIKFQ